MIDLIRKLIHSYRMHRAECRYLKAIAAVTVREMEAHEREMSAAGYTDPRRSSAP
jgi:hypothetical protein